MKVRASLRAFEHGHDAHHQQRTDERRDHVVLRVPFITLTAQPLHSFSRRDYFRDDALDNFKATADCEDDRYRERETPCTASDSAKPQKQFPNRKHQ